MVWAAVLVWAPRRLAPNVGLRAGWTETAALGLLGAVTLVLTGSRPGEALEIALLVQTAAALAIFDLRWLLIPDLHSLALAVAGVFGPLSPGWSAAAIGGLVGAGLLAGVRWAAGRWLEEEAMGFGDVKLAAALGVLLGPQALLWTIALAAGLGAGLALALRRRHGRLRVPLGAFLAPVGVGVLWTCTA